MKNPLPMLAAIFSAHGLGDIQRWARLDGGRNNPSFIVNEAWVVRFDGLPDRDDHRFKGEEEAYATLRQRGLPSPARAFADISHQIVPVDYMVLSYVSGGPILDTATQLLPTQRRALAKAAGRYLAQIHSTQYTRFGPLCALPTRDLATWYDFIHSYFTAYVERARLINADTEAVIAHMTRWLSALKNRLQNLPYGVLAHTDYHFENILQADGHITAIVDWEWAVSGDPSWDFHVEDQWDDIGNGCKAAVYDGYTAIRALPDDHAERVRFYKALRALDDVVESLENGQFLYHQEALMSLRALCNS